MKIDPKVSLLLHFPNFVMQIRLPYSVQAKLALNTICRCWIDYVHLIMLQLFYFKRHLVLVCF